MIIPLSNGVRQVYANNAAAAGHLAAFVPDGIRCVMLALILVTLSIYLRHFWL